MAGAVPPPLRRLFLQSSLLFPLHDGRLHEGDGVALEQDPPDRPAIFARRVDLLRVVEHQVHVLVEAADAPLHDQRRVVEQPDLYSCALRERDGCV